MWGYGLNADSESTGFGHGALLPNEYGTGKPTLIASAALEGARIGRCHDMPQTHALAFVMGTHDRLGSASPVCCLNVGEHELLRIVAAETICINTDRLITPC